MSMVIKLVHSSDPNRVFDFRISSSSSGVDIGEIGRRLGVDPATIRLNGHFLSTTDGTHRFVSTVTWDSLLSFFSTRGFSTGTSDCDAIVVQGKPASSSSAASDSEANGHLSSKRKMKLEDESPVKRNRVSGSFSSACKTKNEVDVDSISIDRRLKLDDNVTAKRPKISHGNSGFVEEASKIFTTPSLYSANATCNCTDGPNEEEIRKKALLPRELINLCLKNKDRALSLLPFEIFVWTSSSFRKANRHLLEACWKNAVDQNDWAALNQASMKEGWSDEVILETLKETVLFKASMCCYGPGAEVYDGDFGQVLPLRKEEAEMSVESVLMMHRDFPDAGKLMMNWVKKIGGK